MAELCKHELTLSSCDYCRPKPAADLFSGPVRPARSDGPGPIFIAAFTSECPGCGFEVETDDQARMVDGHAWHAGCATSHWVEENTR